MDRQTIAAFDFDKTITTRDTFVPFLFFAFGFFRTCKAFLTLAPEAVFVIIGISNRNRFKEKLIKYLFYGQSVTQLRQKSIKYTSQLNKLYRPQALKAISWHKKQGHRCIMVSASLDLYLNIVSEKLGFNDLVCTQLSYIENIYDGNLIRGNCRDKNKVLLLEDLLGALNRYEIYAYGDSDGDTELLAIADYAYYRIFPNW
jgi:HAD superfamily hydrolase (TIGR01490 family)